MERFKNRTSKFFLVFFIGFLIIASTISAISAKNSQNFKKENSEEIKPGVETFVDNHLDWIEDKRVGLITNPTGIARDLESSINVLHNHPDVNLTTLFGPEHGIRGAQNSHVDSYIDEKTGLPVHSLYGSTWKPTEEMLEDVDVLLFDIQDIDSNVYTYIYTLGFAMEAAAEHDKELIVLDRPNPNGGMKVEGPVRSKESVTVMGRFRLPVRHGMTTGELATMWNHEHSLGINLKVAEITGWERTMTFEDTNLPWVMTSPAIPTENSAHLYPGTYLVGGTSLSNGLGTTRPFELVGAPWIDARQLTEDMKELELPGLTFSPTHFVQSGELIHGTQVHVNDPSEINQVELALHLIDKMREQNPEKFTVGSNYHTAIGDPDAVELIKEAKPVDEVIGSWEEELNNWTKNVRNPHLLYPPYPNDEEKYTNEGVLGILPLNLSTVPGQEVDLTTMGFDEHRNKLEIDSNEINWEVSNDLGYIEKNVLYAEKEGNGEIIAKYDDYQASREIEVITPIIENIRLGIESTHTRVVFDLNTTTNNYEIIENENNLTIKIHFAEINGELDKEGGSIDVEGSPILSSINYSTEDEEFIASFDLKEKEVEYATPEHDSRIVIDLQH